MEALVAAGLAALVAGAAIAVRTELCRRCRTIAPAGCLA